MKRKRNQNEESSNVNSNSDKKMRVEEFDEETIMDAVLDNSLIQKKEFVLTREIADNAILCDIAGNKWRIGVPVGAGSFGEIYLASNDICKPVNFYNANFVTKIEPHSNGPLFVEIHCLLNVNKANVNETETDQDENGDQQEEVLGIPKYIASGSHYFNDSRYRFLIMPRYKADLHSIIKSRRLSSKHFLILAHQVIDVLQRLHEKNYVHSDIKAQNIMIGQFNSNSTAAVNGVILPQHKQKDMQPPLYNSCKKTPSKASVQYGGSNPLRTCRIKEDSHDKSHHTVYNDMVRSHYLRPARTVDYSNDESIQFSSSNQYESNATSDFDDDDDDDEDFKIFCRKKTPGRRNNNNSSKSKRSKKHSKSLFKNAQQEPSNYHENDVINNKSDDCTKDDHVYIIDYGLATKFVDTNGEHRPFCMDQRRAHDGTIEFTSRDAHFGAHSRRSDLECFGYNLIYWSQGYLPWKDEKLKDQPEIVHRLKEIFMTDVKEMLKLLYGKNVPKYLGEFMHYVGQLEFDEEPDYDYLKRLFEKEFLKLGFKKSDMKLSLNEVRDECEPFDRSIPEHDLLMANITDLKTVTKLGFLVATTDTVDGNETLVKPKESLNLNLSCKASPKNLRSKEKDSKDKRPKRERKVLSEKDIVNEKIAKGKKLSIHEIAILDPEQIARDRAEKEYEKFDDKVYYQTPQRYKGNPTYAILEIENKLKIKQNGSAYATPHNNSIVSAEIEPIKGYTKPMMDVLKKQQIIVEQQICIEQNSPISTYQKRNREGLRNVIKHTQKNITYQNEVNLKKQRTPQKQSKIRKYITPKVNKMVHNDSALDDLNMTIKRSRGRPRKLKSVKRLAQLEEQSNEDNNVEFDLLDNDDNDEAMKECADTAKDSEGTSESTASDKRRKIRNSTKVSKSIKVDIVNETEEDSVYYDIPGEGSNDANSEIVDDEDETIQPVQKRTRKRDFSSSVEDENSNHSSVTSASKTTKKHRNRYYNDEDFEVQSDDESNQSSVTYATKTSVSSYKPARRLHVNNNNKDIGKVTRNKTKSRSTSRTAAVHEHRNTDSEESEEEEVSEFEMDESADESEGIDFDQDISEEENGNATDESEEIESAGSELDEDSDSIDIKYSPIKTRHARKRIMCFNMKQMRGRRVNILDEDVRNFRLVSTRG